MAMRRRYGRRGYSRAKRNVEWVAQQDAVLEPNGEFEGGVQENAGGLLYDFRPSALDPDDRIRRYGDGTWTVERMLGCLGVAAGNGTSGQLVKFCFAIGLLGSPTGVAAQATPFDWNDYPLASAKDQSWMLRMCCFVNLESWTVEKCDFDIHRSRKLSQDSALFWTAEAVGLPPGGLLRYRADVRLLLSERGSRV